MRVPKQVQRRAQLLWHRCLVDGLPDTARIRQTVASLVERQPRHVAAIAAEFLRYLRLDAASRHAVIETAVPLSPARQDEITGMLKKLHGDQLTFEYVESPSAIGGLRIRVGSDVYDGTVRHRLQRLMSLMGT